MGRTARAAPGAVDAGHEPERHAERHTRRTRAAPTPVSPSGPPGPAKHRLRLNPGRTVLVAAPLLLALLWLAAFPQRPSTYTVILAVLLYYAYGLCYTAGYHRLWAHRCYTASAPLRVLFAAMGAANFVGPILPWCRIHRAHHAYMDSDRDPLSINRGFFYAYLGCHALDADGIAGPVDVSDLTGDSVVRTQQRIYAPLAVCVGWILPGLVASVWGDFWGGFFVAGVLRSVAFQHVNWFTRALGHVSGHRPYNELLSARNNTLLSVLTLGENYLNFHAEFPGDYRMGVRFWHVDATKWVLRLLSWLGLARDLHKTPLKVVRDCRRPVLARWYGPSVAHSPPPRRLPLPNAA